MRCNIIKTPIELASGVIFNVTDNKPAVVFVTGLVDKYGYNPLADLVSLLTTANVGLSVDEDKQEQDYITFSYETSTNWTKRTITISDIKYSLYENSLTFGVAKNKLRLSFIVKDYTSDSQTFYEDLVGKVLTSSADIKGLSWLLSIGDSITGRALKGLEISNKMELVNHTIDCSPSLQVMSSNSTSPRTMYVTSDSTQTAVDLNTIKSVTIRNKMGEINLVYTTKNNGTYTLLLH